MGIFLLEKWHDVIRSPQPIIGCSILPSLFWLAYSYEVYLTVLIENTLIWHIRVAYIYIHYHAPTFKSVPLTGILILGDSYLVCDL